MDKNRQEAAVAVLEREATAERKRTGSVPYLVAKRCFDFRSSFCVSIVLPLPLAILALTVVVKDFGNPFYAQKRVGLHGKDLFVLKLRSMKKGADDLEKMLTQAQLEKSGAKLLGVILNRVDLADKGGYYGKAYGYGYGEEETRQNN